MQEGATTHHLADTFPLVTRVLIVDIKFKDTDLHACVSNTANANGWQYVDEMTSLICDAPELFWLDGIEALSQLKSLSLTSELLDQFGQLSALSNLTHLSINSYRFNQFDIFANMPLLEHLELLTHLKLAKITLLEQLPQLTYLKIG